MLVGVKWIDRWKNLVACRKHGKKMAMDDQTSICEKRKESLVVGEQKGWQDQAEMAGTMKSVSGQPKPRLLASM